MWQSNKSGPPSKSGISASWDAVAAVVSVLATFFITPVAYNYSVAWVREFTISQYGIDWVDAATALWGLVIVFLVYWIANMFTHEFLIERGLKRISR